MNQNHPAAPEAGTSYDSASISLPLGQLLATPGALRALAHAGQSPIAFLRRHMAGDWGEVCPEDAQANAHAAEHGGRILSAYTLSSGVKIWIITEADRSATTLLLPEEY